MNISLKSLGKKALHLLNVISSIAWVFAGLYSILIGLKKLFSDNSFSLGNEKVISVFDTKPIAIMFIICGVLVLYLFWLGYKRNCEENESKQK